MVVVVEVDSGHSGGEGRGGAGAQRAMVRGRTSAVRWTSTCVCMRAYRGCRTDDGDGIRDGRHTGAAATSWTGAARRDQPRHVTGPHAGLVLACALLLPTSAVPSPDDDGRGRAEGMREGRKVSKCANNMFAERTDGGAQAAVNMQSLYVRRAKRRCNDERNAGEMRADAHKKTRTLDLSTSTPSL